MQTIKPKIKLSKGGYPIRIVTQSLDVISIVYDEKIDSAIKMFHSLKNPEMLWQHRESK